MVDMSKFEPEDIASQDEDDDPQFHMGSDPLPPLELNFEEVFDAHS